MIDKINSVMIDEEKISLKRRDSNIKPRTWRSGCIEADRQSVVYFGQLSVSFSVLVFCATMLVRANGDCDKSSPYIGLISFILGKTLSSIVGGNEP